MSSSYSGAVADSVWDAAGLHVRLSLLGRFGLERNGQAVRLRTRKDEAMLAYLVLYPGRHAREILAEHFWGDTPEHQARASLRAALADLRSALGPEVLTSDRVVVQFCPTAGTWVDVFDFRARAEAFISQEPADPEAFNPSLYTGELLAGHYDDWVLAERERLHRLYLDATLRQVAALRSLAHYDEAIAAAHRALAVDPAEERAHQHLIFLYGATGNRPAALRQMQLCRRSLKEELDVEPSAETLALVDTVTAAATFDSAALSRAAAHPAGIGNLPTPLTSFVGRQREIAAVSELVGPGESLSYKCRLVTLTGAGGSGKTRLAIEVARMLASNYRHGVWWVDLSSVTDPSLVPDTTLHALGVMSAPGQPPLQTLVNYLRDRMVLLVVDNCEHLAQACAQLAAAILEACPAAKVLATSREPLDVPGEQLWPVPTFSVPAPAVDLSTEVLLRYDAVQLFVERARMHRPAFGLRTENVGQVAEICRRLDGIPLAIELAAARVRTMEVDDILARLENRLRLLASASTLAAPRQQTLRASIDWSYNLLSPAECLLLQRLAVFVGGWSLASAEAVCADHDLPHEQILDLLARLVDRSLVVAQEGRYRLLEAIREYALERLADAGEEETLRDRHASYFAAYLVDRSELILSSEQRRGIIEITAEIDNVGAAWDWAVLAHRYEILRCPAGSLIWYYEMHNRFQEGEAMYGRATATLAGDPVADPGLLAGLRARHGYFLGRLGRLGDAYRQLEQSTAYLRQANLPSELALSLTFLGTIVWQEGEYANARVLLEESLAVNRVAGERHWVSLSLFMLALLEHSTGNDVKAEQYFGESLSIGRATGQPRMISMVSVFSAPTLLGLGQYAEARDRLQHGLALARTSQDWWLVGTALGHLGIVLHAQGDSAGATTALLEAVTCTRETGNRWDQAWVEVSLADVYLAAEDAGPAEAHYRQGLQLATEAAAWPIAMDAVAGFAELRARAGDRARALELAGHVSLHPASTGNARARAAAVGRMLDPDGHSLPSTVTGTFDDMLRWALA